MRVGGEAAKRVQLHMATGRATLLYCWSAEASPEQQRQAITHVSPGPWMTSIGRGPAQSSACVRGHTCLNQAAASRSTPGGLIRCVGVPGGNSTQRLCPAGGPEIGGREGAELRGRNWAGC